MRRGSQDETRLPADKEEVIEGMAAKQTMIPSEDGKQTDSSKLNNIQTQIPFKERSNITPRRTASNQEFSLWWKKEPPDQRENQRRKASKKMTFQLTTSDTSIRRTEITAKWMQEGTHEGPSAHYAHVQQGHGTQGNIKKIAKQPTKERSPESNDI